VELNRLQDIIKARIAERGRITFAEFMDMALYYPELGYYTSARARVGADGDFYTSPATHPAFAALIAVQLEQMWQLLDHPPGFAVVEMGAGKGLLAQDILDYLAELSPPLARSINYITMERDSVSVVRGGGATPPTHVTGCILSNELLDALPTHLVTVRDGRIQEIYITLENDGFSEVIDEPSTPQLEAQLSQENIILPEGYRTEVNLKIARWAEDVANLLDQGFVITIDYGYPASDLYGPKRGEGTLMTYYRHTCTSDPYIRLGQQDITTHVDFTAVILHGERNGLKLVSLASQRQFLLNLGLDAFLEALAGKGLPYQEYLANRYSMLELVREEGMGNFKVLLQSKRTAAFPFHGTTPDNVRKRELWAGRKVLAVPLLREEHMPLLTARHPGYGWTPPDFDD
jgi:SAM-dependent MidA family methyltransferase